MCVCDNDLWIMSVYMRAGKERLFLSPLQISLSFILIPYNGDNPIYILFLISLLTPEFAVYVNKHGKVGTFDVVIARTLFSQILLKSEELSLLQQC